MNLLRLWGVVVLFLLIHPAASTAAAHTLYIPFVRYDPGKSGIAWNKAGYHDVSEFGFAFYHVWTVGWDTKGLPQERQANLAGLELVEYFSCPVRPYAALHGNAPVEENLLKQLDTLGDTPRVLPFLNEPDRPGQCVMSARDVADIYLQVKAVCPSCLLTMPNVSHEDYTRGWGEWADWGYSREFLYWLKELNAPLPTIGAFHIYVYPVVPVVDSYVAMLLSSGLDVPVWITEYGHCNPETAVLMYRDLLLHPKVARMFWFSAVGGGCSDLFLSTSDNALSPLGDRLRREITLFPYLN